MLQLSGWLAGDVKESRNGNPTGDLQMAADRTRHHPLCRPVSSLRYSLSLRDVEELLGGEAFELSVEKNRKKFYRRFEPACLAGGEAFRTFGGESPRESSPRFEYGLAVDTVLVERFS